MPATGPIPAEVAKCFEGQAGKYGKDVVSTGPYMIEGADKVDALVLELKPMSGSTGSILTSSAIPTTTRRPTPGGAPEPPDEFDFTIDPNVTDIVDRVARASSRTRTRPAFRRSRSSSTRRTRRSGSTSISIRRTSSTTSR